MASTSIGLAMGRAGSTQHSVMALMDKCCYISNTVRKFIVVLVRSEDFIDIFIVFGSHI